MVGHAFVLTAGLLSGQVVEGPVVSTPQQNCNCQKGSSGPLQPMARYSQQPLLNRGGLFGGGGNSGNRPLLTKIGGLFGKGQNQDNVAEVVPDYYRRMPTNTSAPTSVTSEPPLMDRTIQPAAARPQSVKPIAHEAVELSPGAKQPSPLLPQFAGKVGHEEDYSWITGQLQQENGVWVIYYATPETVDRFGGNLVIQPHGEIRNVQDGDLVSLQGSVVQANGRPVYRATRLDLIERDK